MINSSYSYISIPEISGRLGKMVLQTMSYFAHRILEIKKKMKLEMETEKFVKIKVQKNVSSIKFQNFAPHSLIW